VSRLPGIDPGDFPSAPPGQSGGEGAARRRLDGWLRDGLHGYETACNELARQGTSRLSSYLHFGCISPAEAVVRARTQGAIAEAFVRQLCWRGSGVELRLFAFGPSLLRFGLPELNVSADRVCCRYPICGGLLARRPGGAITLSQCGAEEPELRATVTAYVPRLALPLVYDRLQHRLHVRISRRYFRRLIAEAAV
jgi:hypothetical protein